MDDLWNCRMVHYCSFIIMMMMMMMMMITIVIIYHRLIDYLHLFSCFHGFQWCFIEHGPYYDPTLEVNKGEQT